MKNIIKIIFKWGALLGAGLSLIKLLGFFALNIDYPFEPISDLLMVIAFVACLYMGIKELRDDYQDGLIKYTRAFVIGFWITLLAYLIMVVFLMVDYQYIDKDGVARINQQNIEKAQTAIAKDTITQNERDNYLSQMQEIILKENATLGGDSITGCDSLLHVIINQQWAFVKHSTQNHQNGENQLGEFYGKTQESLSSITESVLNSPSVSSGCNEHIRHVIAQSQPKFASIDPAKVRFENIQSQIPHSDNAYDAAFKHSFAILLYGIMLDIFVALFLFRNEKTICSRNGNLDAEIEGEDTEDAVGDEDAADDTPDLTENKQ